MGVRTQRGSLLSLVDPGSLSFGFLNVASLDPTQLSVNFLPGALSDGPLSPRRYTLTHSDVTGELFLTIGLEYHLPQVSGWYTRLMRDEVLACWDFDPQPFLAVHCHVSGGLAFGPAPWRAGIFRYHMPLVLEAFRFGDRKLVESHPHLGQAPVEVHLHYRRKTRIERTWGVFDDYARSNMH